MLQRGRGGRQEVFHYGILQGVGRYILCGCVRAATYVVRVYTWLLEVNLHACLDLAPLFQDSIRIKELMSLGQSPSAAPTPEHRLQSLAIPYAPPPVKYRRYIETHDD